MWPCMVTTNINNPMIKKGVFCRVSAEGAPEKALRSLVFLITTIRELGYAVAKTGEEAPLEASVLEAAFQVSLCDLQ